MAPGFADSTSMCWQRTGPNPFGPPCGLFRIHLASPNGMKIKSTQRALRRAAASRRMLWSVIHQPVPVGKCWTDQPLAGHARDRVASAAAQDVPSAEPGQYLRTRTASSCGRQATGTHLWATFLCEQKGSSAGGSPAKRLTSLVTSDQRDAKVPHEDSCARAERSTVAVRHPVRQESGEKRDPRPSAERRARKTTPLSQYAPRAADHVATTARVSRGCRRIRRGRST